MEVKFTKNLPFGWDRVNLVRTLYVSEKLRSKWYSNNDFRVSIKTYEGIRAEQMKETLVVFYWIINSIEWILRILGSGLTMTAMDYECYSNRYNPRYLLKRRRYSWLNNY